MKLSELIAALEEAQKLSSLHGDADPAIGCDAGGCCYQEVKAIEYDDSGMIVIVFSG